MHGSFLDRYPEADLYVCTGDALPNFPVYDGDVGLRLFRISRAHEERAQTAWVGKSNNQMRHRLGSPDARVVCVRGNHDFVPIAPIFAGCDVTELVGNEVTEVLGRRVTGHRGIPWIHGTWNDETHRPDLIDRMKRMPAAELYLTHYPPWGILDAFGLPGREDHYGLEEMAYRLIRLSEPPSDRPLEQDAVRAVHMFGHIHECGGMTRQEGNVLFSNAATRVNVIDL